MPFAGDYQIIIEATDGATCENAPGLNMNDPAAGFFGPFASTFGGDPDSFCIVRRANTTGTSASLPAGREYRWRARRILDVDPVMFGEFADPLAFTASGPPEVPTFTSPDVSAPLAPPFGGSNDSRWEQPFTWTREGCPPISWTLSLYKNDEETPETGSGTCTEQGEECRGTFFVTEDTAYRLELHYTASGTTVTAELEFSTQ